MTQHDDESGPEDYPLGQLLDGEVLAFRTDTRARGTG